jgi:hypothetical protein
MSTDRLKNPDFIQGTQDEQTPQFMGTHNCRTSGSGSLNSKKDIGISNKKKSSFR